MTRRGVLPIPLSLTLLLAALPTLAAETGSIHGVVRDLTGRSLAGATVIVFDGGRETGARTESDQDGRFELGDLAAGSLNLAVRLPGYVVGDRQAVAVVAGGVTEVAFELRAIDTPLDEIVVSSTFSILRDEPISASALSRQEIRDLPHFADDLYRAAMVLPGTAAGDISGRFGVRGGFYPEILVQLDGQELFEPFHLKDLQGVFSILDPEVIGGVDLMASGFPAEYGDRMTSVLEMTSSTPAKRRTTLGISFSNAWFGSAGAFAEGKGHWLGSLRRGYLDMVLEFAQDDDEDDEDVSPQYWDAFGKIAYQLTPRQHLALETLVADDSLSFDELEADDDFSRAETGYGSRYVWLTHQTLIGDKTVVDTSLSTSRVDGERTANFLDGPEFFDLTDDRVLDVLALKQSWAYQPSDRHYFKAGFEVRDYEATYDYVNTLFQRFPLDDPRFPPAGVSRGFTGDFSGEHYTLYAADRLRLGERLTAELGLRYDEQTLLDDSQVSPRVNLVFDLGRDAVLRAGWGRFYQSQRPHELDVQFGETEFFEAEQADHLTLGYEKNFRKISFRADAYHRDVDNPRPRYETVFDPFEPFPESAQDLARIDPDSATAQGLELHIARRGGKKFSWWATYALSQAEDTIDDVDFERSIDQTHALTLNANWRPGPKWNLNWVWTYHTGWPTTPVEAELVPVGEGFQLVHHVGPFYSDRLPDYHRLDLRASRTTRIKKGQLSLFIDIQNLYNRENLRGVDIDEEFFFRRQDGSLGVGFPDEEWLGILPS
ncbi:MAG: TonB-dependent receptor, partial [Acidobacteriota bacterium]